MRVSHLWTAAAAAWLCAAVARAQDTGNARGAPSARDQGPVHESWSQRDLQPGAQVVAVLQDRTGYLWLGTTEGI
ncbi:MAG TPA: two-component regulator propeller domain-containing protein, partial [Gemmatimonadaceae bacterium]|nr:two-component regulator propeller domain-containing protein [Gemmatimonadaceae bacterium]